MAANNPLLVKVVQWNILADCLAVSKRDSGLTSPFITVPLQYLHWEYRRDTIIKQLLATRGDVLCLQGVSHYQELLTCLKYYTGLYLPKPLSNSLDGIAILYKRDSLRLVEAKELQLPSNNDTTRVNQVALLAILEKVTLHNNATRKLCVVTTQLKSGDLFSETRLFQCDFLLESINDFTKGLPVICCGDFNAPPTEPVYGHILSSQPPLVSAYTKGHDSEPEYTVWKVSGSGEHKTTWDYIWYSYNKLELINVLCLVPFISQHSHKGLPSMEWPSHHLALEAEFIIK